MGGAGEGKEGKSLVSLASCSCSDSGTPIREQIVVPWSCCVTIIGATQISPIAYVCSPYGLMGEVCTM